ncbi:MAG: hypothetical protein ABL958_09635 [Bdellovibrionia bacterium]
MNRFTKVAIGGAFAVTFAAGIVGGAEEWASLSIKNYRQVFSSMSAVTGVPKTNGVVLNYYNQAYRRLSETGAVNTVNGPLLLTTTILASRFCGQFIAMEAALPADQRKAHQMVDFTKTQVGLTTDVLTNVINNYGSLFWGRSPDSVERQTALTLVQEAVAGQTETVDMTRKALLTACTNYLSGLEFIKQ